MVTYFENDEQYDSVDLCKDAKIIHYFLTQYKNNFKCTLHSFHYI